MKISEEWGTNIVAGWLFTGDIRHSWIRIWVDDPDSSYPRLVWQNQDGYQEPNTSMLIDPMYFSDAMAYIGRVPKEGKRFKGKLKRVETTIHGISENEL
jgi:hypothetical protein